MTFDLRLRAYSPGTDTPLKVWTEPLTWAASVVHNNDGALTVKYSELADGGSIAARAIDQGLDVALEVNHSGTWVEPDNCRFLMVRKGYDRTDPAKVHEVTLPSWSWLLNKICDLNLSALAGAKSKQAGMRVFPATSDAGDVTKKMLDEHDARSGPAVPVVRSSWSTTLDSGGHAWAKKLGKNTDGRAFPAGQPLHDKLDALTKNGLCDWRTRGRGLRIYNKNSACTDLSATVRLRYVDDLSDAPSEVSQADRVARILVKGDGKHHQTEYDPAVPELYGRWEAFIDSSGVKDDDDLEDAGQAELADRNRIKGEYTRTLTMAGKWLPFRDYNVGDWVMAPGADGDEKLRVMQITITRDEQAGLSGNIVLGDRFTNKDLAMAGRVSAITGGSSGVIGNGTSAQGPQPDVRQPAAPTGLSVTPSLYLTSAKRWAVRAACSWSAVTTATDGTALDVASYTVWGTRSGDTQAQTLATVPASGVAANVDGMKPGETWSFTVNATGSTTTELGVMSSTVTVTLPTDTTAPPKPSIPSVTSSASIVTATWNGLDWTGVAMPADLARVDVLAGTSNPPTAVVGSLDSTGTWVGYVAAGTTVYVALRAVDWDGNTSALSTVVSIVVASILDDPALTAMLGTKARIYMQDAEPTAPIPAGSWWFTATGQTRLSFTAAGAMVGSATWTPYLFDASQILTAGTILADNIGVNQIITRHMASHSIDVDVLRGGLLQAQVTLSGIIRTAEVGARVEMDSANGIILYDADDNEVISIKTDGNSRFYGKLTASELTVNGIMSLNALGNIMNPGSSLVLNSGVQAPTTSPSAASYWPYITMTDNGGAAFTPYQVARMSDGKWVTTSSNGAYTLPTYRVHNPDGSWIRTLTLSGSGIMASHEGLTVIGNYAYFYNISGDDGAGLQFLDFFAIDLTTGVITLDSATFSTNYSSTYGTYPKLGTDGTVLLLTYSNKVKVFTVSRAGAAFTTAYSTVKTLPSNGANASAICRGSFDLGVDTIAVAVGAMVRTYTYSTMAENTAGTFPLPSTDTNGIGWYSGDFWSSAAALGYAHDGFKFTGATPTANYGFGYTFYNPTNPYESKVSPRSVIALSRRARFRISVAGWAVGSPTADVTQLRFYAGTAAGTLYAHGNNATGQLALSAVGTSGSTPPGSSNFPASTPAKITNTGESLVISADGTIKAAAVTVTAAKVTGSSGSWSWWYRDLGDEVEMYIEYSGALAAAAVVTITAATLSLPSAWALPPQLIPFAAQGPSARGAVGRFYTDGGFTFRNLDSASQTGFIGHGKWSK